MTMKWTVLGPTQLKSPPVYETTCYGCGLKVEHEEPDTLCGWSHATLVMTEGEPKWGEHRGSEPVHFHNKYADTIATGAMIALCTDCSVAVTVWLRRRRRRAEK